MMSAVFAVPVMTAALLLSAAGLTAAVMRLRIIVSAAFIVYFFQLMHWKILKILYRSAVFYYLFYEIIFTRGNIVFHCCFFVFSVMT